MGQSKNNFIYAALKKEEIRLIKLLPATDPTHIIECTIFNTLLKDATQVQAQDGAPGYEALSYFWGEQTDTQRILLEGHGFNVTKNLNSALRHIRLDNKVRVLWVDAICINQGNDKERGDQVALMGEIYHNALYDLLWLGEDTGLGTAVTELLNLKFDPNDEVTKNASIELVMERLRHPKSGDQLWNQLHKIFGDPPVWTRIWIVQEVLLAPDVKVIYGFHQFPWSTMEELSTCRTRRAIEFREKTSLRVSMDNNASLQIIDSREEHRAGKLRSLTEAIDTFGFFAATEERDKLFALLGLLDKKFDFEPDYKSPPLEVFSKITKSYIRNTGDLRMLMSDLVYAAPAKGSNDVLPSWMPKFNTSSGVPSEPSALHDCSSTSEYYSYSAGKSENLQERKAVQPSHVYLTPPARFCEFPELHGKSPELHVLDLHGFILHKVGLIPNSELAIKWTLHNAIKAFHDVTADLSQEGKNSTRSESGMKGKYLNRDELVDVYFDTLYLGMHGKMSSWFKAVGIDMEKDKEDFRSLLRKNLDDISEDEDDTSVNKDWKRIRDTLGVLACQEKFALTSAGYFAMVPEKAVVGDIICIIYGAEIPLVLREAFNAGNEEYRLIGPAYVHGFMEGEALSMQEKGLLEKERVFHIV